MSLAGLFVLVYWLAFALRFDFRIPPEWRHVFVVTLPWLVVVKLGVFLGVRVTPGWNYHVTFGEFAALVRAAIVSGLVIAAIAYFLAPVVIPRAVLIIDALLTVSVFGALQSGARMFREELQSAFVSDGRQPVLLVVADAATALLAHQINSQNLGCRVCGALTTHKQQIRQRLGRIPVLGHIRSVSEIALKHGVQEILVVAGTLSGRRMRWLMETCEAEGWELKIIPPLPSLFGGDDRIPLRDIEIGDLLHRMPIHLDDRAIGELIGGRRILVTGAGGSIASEICRQVIRFGPSELVLLGRGENRIFHIEAELRRRAGKTTLIPLIGCITDSRRMREVYEQCRPEVVFHAAAHKHVPLMEANVGEAIKNNVWGTKNIVDLADEYAVKSFVLISTDKAVNPVSVMGATKYLAERYVQDRATDSDTRFVIVRLGNVLGSAGSVVPIFLDQIRRGGPITVTDRNVTRYFMTIPEAAQLVLQASSMGRGGEILVLDMGDPVRIIDLASDLIRLSGLPPHSVDIEFVGLRPGEKMHEELYGEGERRLPTRHPKVHLAVTSGPPPRAVGPLLDALIDAPAGEQTSETRQRLADFLSQIEAPGAIAAGSFSGETRRVATP